MSNGIPPIALPDPERVRNRRPLLVVSLFILCTIIAGSEAYFLAPLFIEALHIGGADLFLYLFLCVKLLVTALAGATLFQLRRAALPLFVLLLVLLTAVPGVIGAATSGGRWDAAYESLPVIWQVIWLFFVLTVAYVAHLHKRQVLT